MFFRLKIRFPFPRVDSVFSVRFPRSRKIIVPRNSPVQFRDLGLIPAVTNFLSKKSLQSWLWVGHPADPIALLSGPRIHDALIFHNSSISRKRILTLFQLCWTNPPINSCYYHLPIQEKSSQLTLTPLFSGSFGFYFRSQSTFTAHLSGHRIHALIFHD